MQKRSAAGQTPPGTHAVESSGCQISMNTPKISSFGTNFWGVKSCTLARKCSSSRLSDGSCAQQTISVAGRPGRLGARYRICSAERRDVDAGPFVLPGGLRMPTIILMLGSAYEERVSNGDSQIR